MPAQFENGRKFDSKNSLQDFDATEKYLHPKNQPVSIQKRRKMFCSHHCRVFTRCISNLDRLGFRSQNLPFSNSAGKNEPFSCGREAYPLHFSPFSKCAGIL